MRPALRSEAADVCADRLTIESFGRRPADGAQIVLVPETPAIAISCVAFESCKSFTKKSLDMR